MPVAFGERASNFAPRTSCYRHRAARRMEYTVTTDSAHDGALARAKDRQQKASRESLHRNSLIARCTFWPMSPVCFLR